MTIRAVDCAKRLNSKMERQFGNDFHCGVSKGPYLVTSLKTYYARDNNINWYGTCALNPSRTVNKHSADILCGGAYNHCGRDVICMRDYINEKIKSGAVEMCGKSYNLIVSDARNYIYACTDTRTSMHHVCSLYMHSLYALAALS